MLTPGKCENIHGHSFNVGIELYGPMDKRGMLCSLDFGAVKRLFRGYLDTEFDHRVLLNSEDPWASAQCDTGEFSESLPGLQPVNGDPTTENLARWIGEWARLNFIEAGITGIDVCVQETRVNAASWTWNA